MLSKQTADGGTDVSDAGPGRDKFADEAMHTVTDITIQ